MAITAVGESQSFDYTGGVQTFTVPFNGVYKLEVYGAQGGGTVYSSGGKGGYSYGNVLLKKDSVIYIVVGGKGASDPYDFTYPSSWWTGGYNGGGNGGTNNSYCYKGSAGGGATHIATVSGLLSTLSSNKDAILIVAGGGGGGGTDGNTGCTPYNGGTGGGTNGGNGVNQGYPSEAANGGTQSSGGYGACEFGSFGKGGNIISGAKGGCGGGGGYYGGGCSMYFNGGGGGSGYVGNCIDGTAEMTNGVRSGNGYASITFVKRNFGYVGDKEIVGMALGNTDISGWTVG